MKDRFEKMLKHKGLVGKIHRSSDTEFNVEWPPEIPFYMINQQSFMLSDPEHQEWLEEMVKREKPQLVVFDPLYLMFQGDISSAVDLFPILQFLLYLKNTYNCGMMVIHHYNKSGESKRGGQRMLGSTTLHGWIESAWYLQSIPQDEGDVAEVIMEREFRGAGLHHKLDIEIEMGDMGDPHYDVRVEDYHQPDSKGKNPQNINADLMQILTARNGVTEGYLESNTGYNAKQVREGVDSLISNELAYRKAGKVYLK